MNLLRNFKLSRDGKVTVANLVNELLRRNGDREVSVGDRRPYQLSELQADISRIDAFLFANQSRSLQPARSHLPE